MLTRGLRAWFGNAGNYWGHNAIIRTQAFADCGGLPELPGKPPFGGLILSHDFVEAAFVRRGGYAVRMADDLAGSYEHAPPNLIELAGRDRRWCQGNLQHTRLLGTAGLHPLSRLHLFMGVMSYLASPLWLLFLLAGMSLALHAYLVPPDYFLDRWSLFPDWPRIDPERAMVLFGICMLVLFAPKLLGTAAFLRERALARPARRRHLRPRSTEVLLSRAGRADHDAGADELGRRRSSPAATAAGTPRRATPTACPGACSGASTAATCSPGILLAVAAGAISWRLLAWMSPALLGLVLAVPLSAFMGSAARRPRGWRAWACSSPPRSATPLPSPPPPRREAEALRAARRRRRRACRPSRRSRRRWRATSPGSTRRPRGAPASRTPPLANALLKLADGLGPDPLDARETFAVLRLARDARRPRPATGALAAARGERFVIRRRPRRQVAAPILVCDAPARA